MDTDEMREALKTNAKRVKEPLMKAVFRILFSRLMLVAVLVVLQMYLIYIGLDWLSDYSKYFAPVCSVLAGIVILIILNSKNNEAYKLSWSIIVAVLPIAGLFIYLVTHINPMNKQHFKKVNEKIAATEEYQTTPLPVRDRVKETDRNFRKMVNYLEFTGGFPAYDNTEVKYYPIGDDVFEDMCAELEKAEEFIFIEYFIIAPGRFWGTILDILERKVNEGVEVRVMYDDMGCLWTVPRRYFKKLHQKGIMSHVFAPIRPFLSTYYNNRDHRKIMVIDGKVAFSGGINLADEYINEFKRFGTWKDNAFMLHGDAVRNYTLMFLQMWNASEEVDRQEGYREYLNIDSFRKPDLENDGFVIPYADGPNRQDNVAENVYLDIINGATNHIDIMTPYLIPDNNILHALKHAAKTGVEVNLIMPHIPDKKLVNLVSKSYYRELIRAGVHIYEYLPGFVHTKMVAADTTICATGTINLDYRSLYFHYECGCLLYHNSAIVDIEEDFTGTLIKCREITLARINSWTVFFTIFTGILRVFAPLL